MEQDDIPAVGKKVMKEWEEFRGSLRMKEQKIFGEQKKEEKEVDENFSSHPNHPEHPLILTQAPYMSES
eukprot:1112782-Amorphochlora_amoeboformis.AAC.1